MIKRRICFLAAAALLAGACDEKPTSQRCEEMASYLEGRTQALERGCEFDTQCHVVFVRPDAPIAARTQPDDPQLERVIAEYRDTCAPLPRATGNLDAICMERTLQSVDPDDPSVEITISLGRSCVLRGVPIVPDVGLDADGGPDVVEDVAPDAAPCACTSDAQCGGGETCTDCYCIPDTACGDACVHVSECGLLTDIGVGTNLGACVSNCAASLADEPALYNQYVSCLNAAACDDLADCGWIVQ